MSIGIWTTIWIWRRSAGSPPSRHFQRQFTATFGMSVHRYVQLARMKRASYRLTYRDAHRVTDIAMDAGYDAPDAFARAVRQRFEQPPSSFRKAPEWASWLAAFEPFDHARSNPPPCISIATGCPRAGRRRAISPPYCQRLAFFPEVPEHEASADLFLPLV